MIPHNLDSTRIIARDGVPISVEIVVGLDDFTSLRRDWNELSEQASTTIFQSFEWNYRWWIHFGRHSDRSLAILIFKDQDRVVGIVPLFEERVRLFGVLSARSLRLIGGGAWNRDCLDTMTYYGPSDYLDAIVLPDYAKLALEALTTFLCASDRTYVKVAFEHVRHDSLLLKLDLNTLKEKQLKVSVRRTDICPTLLSPDSVDQFIRNRQTSARRKLSQAHNAIGTAFEVHVAESLESFKGGFKELQRLHQLRWRQKGFPGLFSNKRYVKFLDEVFENYYLEDKLWCATAIVRDTCIGARMALKTKDCMYDYLSGFDDTAREARKRPGLALLLCMLREAVKYGVKKVDFLRGDESYKFDFCTEYSYNSRIVLTSSRAQDMFPRLCLGVVGGCRRVVFLAVREAQLLRVQYDQHGPVVSVWHYLRFRAERLVRKTQRHDGNRKRGNE